MKRKAIELYHDDSFVIDEREDGTHIHGRLAYPGISKNRRLYTVDQLLEGHNKDLPIWLNHAELVGTEDIGEDLLPESYRKRLENKEEIILGQVHQTFNPDTFELLYEAVITDP